MKRTRIVLLATLVALCQLATDAAPLSRVTINLQDIEIRELVRVLGQQAGVNVFTDPAISGTASLHVADLPLEDALRAMLEPRGFTLRKYEIPGDTPAIGYLVYDPAVARRIFVRYDNGLLTLDVQRFQLGDILAEIARESRRSIVPVGDVSTQLTLAIYHLPLDEALSQIAMASGFRLMLDGRDDSAVFRLVPFSEIQDSKSTVPAIRPSYEITRLPDSRVKIRAVDAPLRELLMAVGEAGSISVVVSSDVEGTSTAFLNAMEPDAAVRNLAQQAGLRIMTDQDVLVVSKTSSNYLSLRVADGKAFLDAYEVPVREALTRLAVAGGLPALTFDPSVEGLLSIHLADLEPGVAFRLAAEGRNLRVEERAGGLRVTDPSKEKRLRILQQAGVVSLDLQNAPFDEALRLFSSRTGLNITSPQGDTPVTVNVQSMPPLEALKVLAEQVHLAPLEEASRVVLTSPALVPTGFATAKVENGLMTVEFRDADLVLVAQTLAQASNTNFVVETGAKGSISGTLENVPFEQGLRTFLASKGYRLRRTTGIYRIASAAMPAAGEPAPNLEVFIDQGKLNVDVTDADLGAVLRQIAEEAGLSLSLYGTVRDRINVILKNEGIETGLSKILAGTRFGFLITDSTLIVGDVAQPGPIAAMMMREEIIPLQYFSAKEVPPLLPAEIPPAQIRVIEAQNSIMIVGRPEMIQKTRAFLARLDRRPTQIQIEGLLVEYRTTDAFTYNLSALGINGIAPNVAQIAPSQGAASFTITDLRNFNNPQFQATITALVEKGDASIRARPSISTVSGREARINVQSQENFRITQPSSTQGVPLVQIQSINSGITLRITPYVSENAGDAVTIDLFFEDSSPGDRTSDGLPAIATRNAQNRIVLTSNRTAVVGGLIREDISHQRGGFPILSQLPIIGALFGKRLSNDRQSTLVFYLTASIITSDTSVAQTFADHGVKVEPEALKPPPSPGSI
jgi:type IV pilus assembly protein PilQ